MPKSDDLNPTQMKAAIHELESRISELNEIDVDNIGHGNESILRSTTTQINATVRNIFGEDTIEYEQYQVPSVAIPPTRPGHPGSLHEIKEEVRENIECAIYHLKRSINLFKEKL